MGQAVQPTPAGNPVHYERRRPEETTLPHAKLRAAIVPSPAEKATAHSADHAHAHRSPARMRLKRRLLKRVFDIDIERCPNCGSALKIIAAIEDPPVIVRILTHLGLPSRAPPRSPVRPLALFQAA